MKTIELTDEEAMRLEVLCKNSMRNAKNKMDNPTFTGSFLLEMGYNLSKSILEKL